MIIAGIDYSITSPAVCIDGKDIFYLTSNKKFRELDFTIDGPECPIRIRGLWLDEWETNEQRFDMISDAVLSVCGDVDMFYIEDYAFAAKGQVFNIGENTGMLKHKIWKSGVPFETVNIGQIKKYATDKGNANKLLMEKAFQDLTGVSMSAMFGCKEGASPSSDVVDAYFIWKFKHKG